MADRQYDCHYEEKVGGASFAASVVTAPFNARFVKIHWVTGSGTLEFSFDGTNTHGKISPPANPRTAHPDTVQLEVEGVSKVYLKNTMTVAVTMWR
jgi:hypothetical protein